MKATGSRPSRPAARRRARDRAELPQRHVEHQHVGAACQRVPVEIGGSSPLASWPVANATLWARPRCVVGMPAAAVPPMPALIPGTMRNGTPAAASASASSPPRPNISGSPPFSRTTRWPVARQADQALIDAQLRGPRAAGALADRLQPRLRRERQNLRRHQRVVEHDVGLGQRVRRVQRQQPRIAGAGADQPDGAGLEHRRRQPADAVPRAGVMPASRSRAAARR